MRHVRKLEACGTDTTESCSEAIMSELTDIQAYHKYLQSEAAFESVFTTTVVLHNLVSSSIGPQFQRSGSPVLRCVKQALELVPTWMRPLKEPSIPILPPGVQLPGVGKHRLLDCS